MTAIDTSRPWVPPQSTRFYAEQAARYCQFAPEEWHDAVEEVLARHERFMDHECINLYAGTNMMNPRAARLLASSVGSRPSLGYPGDKYETGMGYAEQVEIMASEIVRRLFQCNYVEF